MAQARVGQAGTARMADSVPSGRASRVEAAFATGYFCLYLGYLFVHPESELLHWLSLVLLPLAGLAAVGRYASPRALLNSIGLDWKRARNGWLSVLLFGTAFQILQFLNVRQREEILGILQQPFGVLLPVAAFGLLMVTVATTEEVFFRGVLQTRLAIYFRSDLAGLALTTIAFTLYHVPYAYLKPSWPSAGDLSQAFQLAAANGVIGGLALGVVYWRSRRNLLAPMLLHALIDLIPATRLVHRLFAAAT
jgi:membrane protease YdiL (CAAX protease family)